MKLFWFPLSILIVSFTICSAQLDTARLYKAYHQSPQNSLERLELLTSLADLHKFTNDSARKYASIGLALAQNLKKEPAIAFFHYRMAISELNDANFVKAHSIINRAILINQKLKRFKELGQNFKIRAIINYYRSDYEAAINDFSSAIDYYSRSGFKLDLPSCYTFMAETARRNDDDDLGYEYDKKAYNTSLELYRIVPKDDPDRDIVDLNFIQAVGNLADYYAEKGNRKIELKYLYMALSKSNQVKYYPTYLVYLANAAESEYKLGNTERGIRMAKEARKLARQHQQQRAESNAYVKLMMMASNTTELIDLYDKGLKIAKEIKNDQLIGNFYLTRSDMAEKFGDYKTALIFYQRYVDRKDSVERKNRKERILQMETTFRLKENQYKLRETQRKSLLSETTTKNLTWLAIVLSAILTIFVLLMYRIWGLNKRISKQHDRMGSLNEFKGTMMNVIGHDVNGMLSAMGAVLYLMENEDPDKFKRSSDLRTLAALRQEAFELLHSLIIWSDHEQTAQGISCFNVKETIAADIKTIEAMSRFYGVMVNIKISDLTLDFNIQHFRFIIRNLALNSLKYAISGTSVNIVIVKRKGEVIAYASNRASEHDLERLRQLFAENDIAPVVETSGYALALKLSMSLARKNGAILTFEEKKGGRVAVSMTVSRGNYTGLRDSNIPTL